jgi:uncharacterized protein
VRYAAEFRSEVEGSTLEGHAAVFGQYAELPGHLEEIAPGAFDRALDEGHDVRLLVNHDPSHVLARTASGTLRLAVDDAGLRVKADLPDTTVARDLAESMRRRDVDQMSFGFVPRADEWTQIKGKSLRTITDLDLFDVSVVTFPAYKGTDAALRAYTFPAADRRSMLIMARHRARIGGLSPWQ